MNENLTTDRNDTQNLDALKGEQEREDGTPPMQKDQKDQKDCPELASNADPSTFEDGIGDDTLDGGRVLSRQEHEEYQKKLAERDLYLDELLRARADFENFRKRVNKERPELEAQAGRQLIRDLLPVGDCFERAFSEESAPTLESFQEGVRMIQQMFLKFLADHEVMEIEALDRPFDPQLHHAVQQLPIDDPERDGLVVQVLQKGYIQRDRVIRPAGVIVGKATASGKKGSEAAADATGTDSNEDDDGNAASEAPESDGES